jgi:hypothetical protein
MANDALDWGAMLDSQAPKTAHLERALFTTYDRPDGQLVAEQLLRKLLRVDEDPQAEGRGRTCFLLELHRRLAHLRKRIVFVSSTMREEPGEPLYDAPDPYQWMWRQIEHLTVGHQGAAVQHAKLWMLHWVDDTGAGSEYLELVVSSTNLTRSAFTSQIQAAWRVLIPLTANTSQARQKGWGILPDFLVELGKSTASSASFEPFVALLGRADCPPDVTFVASVPGTHSPATLRKTPWGSVGLSRSLPIGSGTVKVGVNSPFIGDWSRDALEGWSNDASSSPEQLSLVWIDADHAWAVDKRWTLPRDTRDLLADLGVPLLHFGSVDAVEEDSHLIHDQQSDSDTRWSHAKLYAFQRGSSRRLLLTSANFSPSAWGTRNRTGDLRIRNFELGVSLKQLRWPFANVRTKLPHDRASVIDRIPAEPDDVIVWAAAVWDGATVTVTSLTTNAQDVRVTVESSDSTVDSTLGPKNSTGLRTAVVQWPITRGYPDEAVLRTNTETVRISVQDARDERDMTPEYPPEIGDAAADSLHEEMLFARYNGQYIDEQSGVDTPPAPEPPDKAPLDGPDQTKSPQEHGSADSYGVAAFEVSRRYLAVVDGWQSRADVVAAGAVGQFRRRVLQHDAERLIVAFGRRASADIQPEPALRIGARLAAEELKARLKFMADTDE